MHVSQFSHPAIRTHTAPNGNINTSKSYINGRGRGYDCSAPLRLVLAAVTPSIRTEVSPLYQANKLRRLKP